MNGKAENPDPFGPLCKTILIEKPVAGVFDFFTRMSEWWPLSSHSMGREKSGGIEFPGKAGLEISESLADGARHIWGRVVRYEPPTELVFTWHPGRPPTEATEVEVRFYPEGPSLTRVELIHRGWRVLAGEPVNWRGEYDRGWDFVFGECFARRNGQM
jgi:uncharacterized protein YndB with AHSA1/START domain